ncbi:hypothetical protein J2TS4_43490 [Paenibacillus sp. J2TS4]|nr:hypothetical protein J2TS4_43490 [Paenibacillus sp. J2TS4]
MLTYQAEIAGDVTIRTDNDDFINSESITIEVEEAPGQSQKNLFNYEKFYKFVKIPSLSLYFQQIPCIVEIAGQLKTIDRRKNQ